MIINVGDNAGGVIVQDTEPVGDETMIWVDTGHYGIAKYWDIIAEQWKPIASVWM